ncbi:hypothetical protein [Campylobacter vicugnae]|uniref:hypothetical protein n=1 Tax=Campylobacter vicugnae TaxID=1660076 RepID=UPI001865A2A5|nr:hypothetical protein [Campylobacter sp. RM8964]
MKNLKQNIHLKSLKNGMNILARLMKQIQNLKSYTMKPMITILQEQNKKSKLKI